MAQKKLAREAVREKKKKKLCIHLALGFPSQFFFLYITLHFKS